MASFLDFLDSLGNDFMDSKTQHLIDGPDTPDDVGPEVGDDEHLPEIPELKSDDDGNEDNSADSETDEGIAHLLELLREQHEQEIADDDDIGDANDHHNKSCDFARKRNYKDAVRICEAGLKKFPLDVDLVADLINYYSKMGDFAAVHRYLQMQLDSIPRPNWNWRSYTFAVDALIAESAQQNEELLRSLTADYEKYLPFEERAYQAEHDVAKALGNEAEAIEALEKALRVHPAAQTCCLRLADYLIERGNFERARTIALKGIGASAQGQPSIRTAYCAFLVCLCDDALLWLAHAEGNSIEKVHVEQVMKEYEALEQFKIKLLPYHDQIKERRALLDFMLASIRATE